MKNYWKQFAVWATGLKINLFQRARFRLTAYYILVIAVILSVYSLILFQALAGNLRDGEFGDEQVNPMAIDRTIDNLKTSIFIIDLIVLVLVSFLSYILAGRTLKPIKKSLEAQQQFSANASHELRTPLAIMKTDSEVALRNPRNTLNDLRVLTESNLEEVERMSKIVNDLLILSRSQRLKETHFSKIDLSEAVIKMAHKMRQQALNKNVSLNVTKTEGGFISGDNDAVEQMILNILQNAVNYTPEKGSIEVALENKENFIELKITDTGIGIEKNKLSRIFERFYKADDSRTSVTEGAGLGLSIVKEIVDNHRGKITISSELNKGTEVIIQFARII